MKRIEELDGLRAVAILLVIGCHYPGFCTRLGGLPEFGWVGVEIFFAISGYLITSILIRLRNKPSPYRIFYSRRSVRILPVYFLVTILMVPGIYLEQHIPVRSFLTSQLFFLQGFGLSLGPTVAQAVRHPLNALRHVLPLVTGSSLDISRPPHMSFTAAAYTFWSLSVEEYFYLLWAPVILHLSKRTIPWVAGGICVGCLLLRGILRGGGMMYFWTPCRLDALIYGALIALAIDAISSRKHLNVIFSSCVAGSLVVLAWVLFVLRPVLGHEVRSSPLFMTFGLTCVSIAAAGIVGLLVIHVRGGGGGCWVWLRSRPLLFIGTISYTMYLTHAVIASLISNLPIGQTEGNVLALVLTIGVSYASWHWIERPLLSWKDKRFPNAPHPKEPSLV